MNQIGMSESDREHEHSSDENSIRMRIHWYSTLERKRPCRFSELSTSGLVLFVNQSRAFFCFVHYSTCR